MNQISAFRLALFSALPLAGLREGRTNGVVRLARTHNHTLRHFFG